MQHKKNMVDIDSFRPSLSTVAADMRSPGSSEAADVKLCMNNFIHVFMYVYIR